MTIEREEIHDEPGLTTYVAMAEGVRGVHRTTSLERAKEWARGTILSGMSDRGYVTVQGTQQVVFEVTRKKAGQ